MFTSSPTSTAAPISRSIPADFDQVGFLRVAKVNFIRLQAAWDKADINDLREFTTPQVYAELRQQIEGRGVSGDTTEVVTIAAELLGIEAVRRAQERYGKGKVMTGEQVRWGLENLNLTQAKLDGVGFAGVMRPISTSCADHMGSNWARVHTWDGKKWAFSSDWLQADEQILKPLVKATAAKYAADKKLTPRTPADCQS